MSLGILVNSVLRNKECIFANKGNYMQKKLQEIPGTTGSFWKAFIKI